MTEKAPLVQSVFRESVMDAPEAIRLPGGNAVVFSTKHPTRESANEDAALVIESAGGGAVLAVADGMGGQRSGHLAAGAAVTSIHSWVTRAPGEDFELRNALLNGIEEAGREIQGLGVGAGSTIAAVEMNDSKVRPYHVGDSMILIVGQRGVIKLQTVAHSPVGLAVEAGVMDEDEAMHHEERHLVLNFVGSPEMRIEIGSVIKLARRDTLIIASDGLGDNLTVEEVVECARKGPLEAGVSKLVALARQRMAQPGEGVPSKPDDLTVIAYRRN